MMFQDQNNIPVEMEGPMEETEIILERQQLLVGQEDKKEEALAGQEIKQLEKVQVSTEAEEALAGLDIIHLETVNGVLAVPATRA